MAAHLFVLYPTPKDPQAFARAYRDEHLPFAGPRLVGASGVTTRRLTAPGGDSPFHALSDVLFPTLAALQACAASTSGREALAHAASISTGGAPLILVATDDLA
jgi:uncharacterized protein (TIGR02118 family)